MEIEWFSVAAGFLLGLLSYWLASNFIHMVQLARVEEVELDLTDYGIDNPKEDG